MKYQHVREKCVDLIYNLNLNGIEKGKNLIKLNN